jgi:hypothetical protein
VDCQSLSLIFHFLNVGHGSSIVVEAEKEGKRFFGIIDSNCPRGEVPKALTKLRQLGAERLSFVCLTHPHKDHYSGLFGVISAYEGRIDNFFSFPMGDLIQNKDRFKKLVTNFQSILKKTDGTTERYAALELIQILRWADSLQSDWVECAGNDNRIGPFGFADVDVTTVLPPRAAKGGYIDRIEKGDSTLLGNVDDNDLSLAISFEYAGVRILLGGDATAKNWEIRKRFELNTGRAPAAQVVNLPHHGSRYDNPDDVLDRLFAPSGERYAITSANGQSHPSPEVIGWVSNHEIHPYCTNLMASCGATIARLNPLPAVDEELARLVREAAKDPVQIQVCQGDVAVTIDDEGKYTVTPEYNHFCAYRKGSALLDAIA